MTSFGRQFDFHDVIYHIQSCNVDNRRRNVISTTNAMEVQNVRVRKKAFQTRDTRNSTGAIVIR